MQIPIISGIYRSDGQLQPAYPINLIPTPKGTGISDMFLRPAEGLKEYATGRGNDKAAIVWSGTHYRVSGDRLISVGDNGIVRDIGHIGDAEYATLDYGFDRLLVVSGGNVYYSFNNGISKVTDEDLGYIIDGCWIDGYYLFTDGNSLIITELNDPHAINPIKYGSSEADPDKVVAVKRIRTELYAINRYTIEAYDNIGGDLFPFQRIDGAMTNKGAIGTKAACVFEDSIAFVGGGRSESLGLYLAQNSQTKKLSTPDIDKLLNSIPEAHWPSVHIESRIDASHQWIYIHLPDRTIVFDYSATVALNGAPVWFVLVSTLAGFSKYRAKNFVWNGGSWRAGDPIGRGIGILDEKIGHHWGEPVRWDFSTQILYNNTAGAIFSRLELIALTGNVDLNKTPRITTSYSEDGMNWKMPREISAGLIGNTTKRLVWLQQGMMKQWRIQRFSGDSYAHISPVCLEAQLEPLSW